MKYTIESGTLIKSVEIAKDLSKININCNIEKLFKKFPYFDGRYVRSYMGDTLSISGLGSAALAPRHVAELISKHPSIYGGVYSLMYILKSIKSEIGRQYSQIENDIKRLSAELDYQFYLQKTQFENLALPCSAILPREKIIQHPDDVASFKGRIIAFATTIPHYARSKFVSPLNQKYRFAFVSHQQFPRECYKGVQCNGYVKSYIEVQFGYNMDCFITSRETSLDTPLIAAFLAQGRISMRLATVTELNYLLQAFKLNQGRLGLLDKTDKFINEELAQNKAAASSSSQESQSVADLSMKFSEVTISARPSYLPGYRSKDSHRPHTKAVHHKHNHSKRRARKRR